MKWATQSIHAILELHRLGIGHGNIHLMDMLVDDNDNVKIFNIYQGHILQECSGMSTNAGQERVVKAMAEDIVGLGRALWLLIFDPNRRTIPRAVDKGAGVESICGSFA